MAEHEIFISMNQKEYQMEKLKCMIHYFRKRIEGKCANSIVTYTRRALTDQQLPRWDKSDKKLLNLRIDSKGTIEDVQNMGMLEVDFANAYIGGGVLGHGCVQEEIRFLICPELIISRFVSIFNLTTFFKLDRYLSGSLFNRILSIKLQNQSVELDS